MLKEQETSGNIVAFPVHGDMMYPLIKDGATVFCDRAMTVKDGDVVICTLDGILYCAILKTDATLPYLQFHNDSYPNLIIGADNVLNILGKVFESKVYYN